MRKLTLITCAAVALISAMSLPARSDDGHAARATVNGGCFLLHSLLDNESDLPILVDLKTAPQEIQDYAIEISRTAKSGMRMLDEMRDHDATLNWDRNPLPEIEIDVRASITEEKQHQLLFGAKGSAFVRALLVSQTEASKYAANIAKVLSEKDRNPDHRRDFMLLSKEWHALNDEAFRLLAHY